MCAFLYGNVSTGGGSQLWEPDGGDIINTNRFTGGVKARDSSDASNTVTVNLVKNNLLIRLITDNAQVNEFRIDKNGAGAGLDIIRALAFATSGSVSGLEATKDWVQLQSDGIPDAQNKLELRVTRAANNFDFMFNGLPCFGIGTFGIIKTNQNNLPGVHPVLAAEIPIYNMGGLLIGYIPVMV